MSAARLLRVVSTARVAATAGARAPAVAPRVMRALELRAALRGVPMARWASTDGKAAPETATQPAAGAPLDAAVKPAEAGAKAPAAGAAPSTPKAAPEEVVVPPELEIASVKPPTTMRESSSASTATAPASARGPISWATLILVIVTGAGLVVYYNVKREQKKQQAMTRVESFGKAALGGPWSLVDASGAPVTSGDLLGKAYLLYFGFTFCPDICPNELVKMAKAIDLLAARSGKADVSVLPVFVTLDPHRDSCAQVGAYCRDFHPRMVALTGTPGQVAKIAKAYRVYFQDVDKKDDDEDYLVDHSIVMYLIGPDGEFIDFYTQMMTAPEIADRMQTALKRFAAPEQRSWFQQLVAAVGGSGGK